MSTQMDLSIFDASALLEQEGESVASLYDIVERFQRGVIVKPPHQRAMVWGEEKKKGWVKRLQAVSKPVGVILTYQINDGKKSPVYLNDGYQRVSTTLEYLENPHLYGNEKIIAEQFIRACRMPIQHRHYKDHDDALVDFQQINLGTHLTPYEFCHGILTNVTNYNDIWKDILDDIKLSVINSGKEIETKKKTRDRESLHKLYRNSYAIFHRFITGDKDLKDFNVSNKHIKMRDVHNGAVIEWKLRKLIEQEGHVEVKKHIQLFKSFIDRETATFVKIWYDDLQKNRGTGISITVYRWLLDVAVWRRNNNIPIQTWYDFLVTFFRETDGKSVLTNVNRDKSVTLSLSKISSLRNVSCIIEYDLHDIKKRSRNKQALKDGYDNSHKLPFSIYGEGETFPEPASLNRARGAKPVDNEKPIQIKT